MELPEEWEKKALDDLIADSMATKLMLGTILMHVADHMPALRNEVPAMHDFAHKSALNVNWQNVSEDRQEMLRELTVIKVTEFFSNISNLKDDPAAKS